MLLKHFLLIFKFLFWKILQTCVKVAGIIHTATSALPIFKIRNIMHYIIYNIFTYYNTVNIISFAELLNSIFCQQQNSFCKDLKIYFIYLFLEGKGGRETSMCERNSDHLLLACPQPGTWPTAQACALTGNEPATLQFTGRHTIHWAAPARASTMTLPLNTLGHTVLRKSTLS